MQAATLLKDYPNPTDQDINAVMAGSLCRCMTYVRIRKAIKLAAARMRGEIGPWLVCLLTDSGRPLRPSRRGFLIAMMGAGVDARICPVAASPPWNCHASTERRAGTAAPANCSSRPSGMSIDPSGTVTVNIIRAEMGQHVGTALARIVADELEADWSKVRIVTVDSDPKWGMMVTGGSWSVWQSFPVLSRAGAAGRIALIEEGAKLLGVHPQVCTARNGAVEARGRSILYGDIVARGDLRRTYTPEQLEAIPIKPPAKRRLIGRDTLALDVPSKTNGKARYGLDAVVEGMIYARPKVPPTRYDSKVVSIDDSAAKGVPGYIQSLALDDPSGTAPGWVMVYADSFIAANRAADLVKVDVEFRRSGQRIRADLQRRAAELIADPKGGALVVDDPGVDAAFASAKQTLERTYTTSTVMHFALEPINALGFRKRRHLRNPYRQSVAVADPAGAGQGAGPQSGQDRDAHVSDRWRIRPAPRRRLRGAGCACRQGRRQAGQDGLHAT